MQNRRRIQFLGLRRMAARVCVLFIVGLLRGQLAAQTTNVELPSFDFTQPAGVQGWQPTHDISSLESTSTGMVVNISGSDPYVTGPAKTYPAGVPLWARLRLYSDQAGSAQIFYFNGSATEANSVRFSVPAARWVNARVPLPGLGDNYRIRIDPPGTGGKAVLASLEFEPRGPFPEFDFKTMPDALDWSAAHEIGSLTPGAEGLSVRITGADPYLFGPARDYPEGHLLWLHLRLISSQGGMAQVFYFNTGPAEENSVKFFVPPGQMYEARVPVPALGKGWRLRIDPPGSEGICLLDRLWFEERVLLQPPAWPQVPVPELGSDALTVTSGDLALTHGRQELGAFELRVAGEKMATGNTRQLIGYVADGIQRWLNLSAPSNSVAVTALQDGLRVVVNCVSPDGGRWTVEQIFSPTNAGAISVECRLTVDRDRIIVYFPALMLMPGLGSFGSNKTQALFCGLEYLENEPSSSEADIIGPESKRQVPDSLKITLPLMAIAAENRYVGLIWEPKPEVSALFDSPDRQFGSTGHVIGLLLPGSDGANRQEGNLLPYDGTLIRSNETRVVRAAILGGKGASVIPAVQQYVEIGGLPPVPNAVPTAVEYYDLAAHSWLDSQIRTNALFRHAFAPGFNGQPAADAATWMRWLQERITDVTLQSRLSNMAAAAIAQIPGAQFYDSYHIGHITYPLTSLLYNVAALNAPTAQSHAQGLLQNFQPDGTVHYRASAGGVDYGKTHYARDANGLTATYVLSLLENAIFAGDRSLVEAGLGYLKALNKFRNTVPRGAQTWEVPLHTPDILASAKLLRCYTLGYELTGDPDYLDQARYWAWTGLPFIYLIPPTGGTVGIYATIPVFGATTWVGSWFGVPVQWCGLVYADALYRFAQYDPGFNWRQVADGISLSGVQQSWGSDDPERMGLLPDSFVLRPQIRGGPAINPATVQAAALIAYRAPRAYDFHSFRWHGLNVHAAGEIGAIGESTEGVVFTVTNWSSRPCSVLVNGFTNQPRVRLNGQETALTPPQLFQAAAGRLVLRIQGTVTVEILSPALPRLQIKKSATNGAVNLYWPAAATNFVLEYSPELPFASSWQRYTGNISQNGETLLANELPGEPRRFFRLRNSP